jgi:hypothetical protein
MSDDATHPDGGRSALAGLLEFVKTTLVGGTLGRSPAAHVMVPVLIQLDDASQFAFEVDRFADGRRVIFVPSAPDPHAAGPPPR